MCVSSWRINHLAGCAGNGRNIIQKRYLAAAGLGHDGLGTADVQTVAVYMHKHVGRTGWLRTAKKWCVISRVLDMMLLNVGFRSLRVVNHVNLALAL